MKTNFTKSLALGLICLPFAQLSMAQSVIIGFDDVVIPEDFPSYSKSVDHGDTGTTYTFVTNGVSFEGYQATWGTFSGFDCSRGTDSVDGSYTNDISAIAAIGYDETENYGVAYVTQMFPAAPQNSHPIGIRLDTDSTQELLGAYFTNTTLTYKYIDGNWENMSSYQVIVKGYKAGVRVEDSVIFDLAKKTETDTVLQREWGFASFETLGAVDSITFEVYSDDITTYTPFYFAFDNIIVKDPPAASVNQLKQDLNITIAPNPTSDYLQILHPENKDMVYHIFNVNGQRIASGNAAKAINVQHLSAGNYFIQVIDKDLNQATRTFVKK